MLKQISYNKIKLVPLQAFTVKEINSLFGWLVADG
jgi:hypothetical protein